MTTGAESLVSSISACRALSGEAGGFCVFPSGTANLLFSNLGNAPEPASIAAACRTAEALKTRKLVFLSDVPGVLRDPKDESTLISEIRTSAVPGLIESGDVQNLDI